MRYREIFLNNNESFYGCAGLEDVESFEEWKANGGILKNKVKDEVGLSKSGIIQRYWINLNK